MENKKTENPESAVNSMQAETQKMLAQDNQLRRALDLIPASADRLQTA